MAPLTEVATLVLAVVTAVTGRTAWRQRPKPGARSIALFLFSIAAWVLALLTTAMTTTYYPSLVAETCSFLASASAVVWFLVFTFEFAGYEHLATRRTVGLLFVEPIVMAPVVLTNELHGLYWSSFERAPAYFSHFRAVPGPLFGLHVSYMYGLFVVASVLLVIRTVRSRSLHRRQSVLISAALLVTWAGNAGTILTERATLQVVGTGVGALALFVAIFGFRLLEVVPTARATVMDRIDVGIVVLEGGDRITDINAYAREILGLGPEDTVVGMPADAALGERFEVFDVDATANEATIELGTDDESRVYRVDVSPLSDRLGRSIGRVFIIQDVTERRRRQRELRRQNERLDEFAEIVAHDLRNPLNVANGYVERMRVADEEYLDEIADAHERMEAIIDDVLALARHQAAIETEPVALESATEDAWETVETADATLRVADRITIRADRGRLLEQLFENLFRNAVEHGTTSSQSQVPEDPVENGPMRPDSQALRGSVENDPMRPDSQARQDSERRSPSGSRTQSDDAVEHAETDVTITIGALEEGFYVADDGPGIDPERREEVFDPGETSRTDGTGFGLAIVDSIADAHGWDVRVTESDAGGARFEFTGVEIVDR
ncbi:sensor histidine kinase [Halapricum hydrolyticum]|uniref:histidine kinase n=1 Tax=Halapricum hydrolyticum TaxID=2979991 RepID=A0AAE3IEP9_9EURY|nr:histidine kinase N-terminal 7TM domain-containing protein [Halapricum hydrolyticum]MCU4717831.1 ATP-binding protein [Halapricum hydrolyticum]MCU4726995.1 ATP-binding protein [Halapricum hydrolyticum]